MEVTDFITQFKNGDILVLGNNDHWIVIYSHVRDAMANIRKHAIMYYAVANLNSPYITIPEEVRPGIGYVEDYAKARLANNEEIQKLIARMEAKGKTWDFEHKAIANLIRPAI